MKFRRVVWRSVGVRDVEQWVHEKSSIALCRASSVVKRTKGDFSRPLPHLVGKRFLGVLLLVCTELADVMKLQDGVKSGPKRTSLLLPHKL